jgi:hypothetical protein
MTVASCIAVGAACTGCASTGYRASSLQDQLVGAGLTERQAVCVTERLEDRFDPRRLSSHVEPTAREVATARTVLRSCGVPVRAR